MLRFILLSILLTILFRAFSRLWSGIVRGLHDDAYGGARGRTAVPHQGVQMVRDPVCGTFVVPVRAVALSLPHGERLFFCSAECRDKYRARPDSGTAPAHGRTA
jgi:YHS domain-containing protein